MRFRIGVHLGDVMEKADGTVYGDGVNIAARLESLADPGGIAVSEAVQAAQRNRLPTAFEDLGEHTVKNIAHAVHAYRVRIDGLPIGSAIVAPQAHDNPLLALPDKPSIAVLPFDNMSGDPEQELFRRWRGRGNHRDPVPDPLVFRHRAQFRVPLQGQSSQRTGDRSRTGRALSP